MPTPIPYISIIMPAYNAAKHISHSINSVLSQTWKDWELLIVDDGSTDQTQEIVSNFSTQDSRIIQIKNDANYGVAQSRNNGIALAQGKWIAFLDSDDCWAPDKLELQLAYIHKTKASFTFTGSSFINEQGKSIPHYLSVPFEITYHELLKQNIISCSSVLIKKELLLPYPMPSIKNIHEDFAVWLQILKNYHISAYGLDKPLLIYRISSKSKSGNKIKAARMTFRVYRYIGLSMPLSIYNWFWYCCKSLCKYNKLTI